MASNKVNNNEVVEITDIEVERPTQNHKRNYYEFGTIVVDKNDDMDINSTSTRGRISGQLERVFNGVFNLRALRSSLGWLAVASEATSVIVTLFTGLEAILTGYVHTRKTYTLDFYRQVVTGSYKSWITIYAAWGGYILFSTAASAVDRIINRRSWARYKQACASKRQNNKNTKIVTVDKANDNDTKNVELELVEE